MRSEIIQNQDTPLYPISTAAKLLGISVHTLRMYERAGFILPFQKESSHRLYSQSDIERLKCIRRAINEDKISIAGIQRIQALMPCWDVIKCSQKDREHCDAFNNHAYACWMYNHKKNICENLDCKSCQVYKEFYDCARIKSKIIEITEKHESSL
ncbi:MAG: MerR family transcriptional regulator [Ignavibacteriales bacterium]|nr:MerR family transcriptional regulator [Ignavibacteriales bacterium]